MTDRLDDITYERDYPVGDDVDLIEGEYLAGSVDVDNRQVILRMGGEDVVMEAHLSLEDIYEVVERLTRNGEDLENVIDNAVGAAVKEGVNEGNYPVMRLLVAYVEDSGLWGHFAQWATEVGQDA